MKPEEQSRVLLGITRSKAKMYEYSVPLEDHIEIPKGADPTRLFMLTIGMLGDHAANELESAEKGSKANGDGRESVRFSTQFFNAFIDGQFNRDLDPLFLLMGSAGFYLAELPGSSQVLARKIGGESPNLEAQRLETLLHWLVQGNWTAKIANAPGRYAASIEGIALALSNFFQSGDGAEDVQSKVLTLRKEIYRDGSPRELLFGDLIGAMALRRISNSAWTNLPTSSDVSKEQWRSAIEKPTFLQELWPAQKLLANEGLFRGKSGVVQMPTSAGKTRAVEVLLRSAFLSQRAKLAVVVAPFRALCHEISGRLSDAFAGEDTSINEMSDVYQLDFLADLTELLGTTLLNSHHVLVVTPEKLNYTLRQAPEIAKHIGLLIFDEGHQFDNEGVRGVTYELLVTELKQLVDPATQVVLISAVIPNAKEIGRWLVGDDVVVVLGTDLGPTDRSVAFTSWSQQRGRLEFVDPSRPERREFYVPRVLESQKLSLKGRERNERLFPVKGDGQSISLYLALKLVPEGGVAIFCGRKDTASGLTEALVEAYERDLTLPKPVAVSDANEVARLTKLHREHFGRAAAASICAAWGVFLHHGNTPHGIRLAVEYAMKEGLAKCVVCTSTLAQGVNLPIRYLIVTSVFHGVDRIRVRDFHNLIGRTGRAGMHTEGTVVFADPTIFDNKREESWRWKRVIELLVPDNVEPCSSTLLSVFDRILSDDRRAWWDVSPIRIVEAYISDLKKLYGAAERLAKRHPDQTFTKAGLFRQLDRRIELFEALESYLMAHRDESTGDAFIAGVSRLAEQTLAYALGTEEQKKDLVTIFHTLAKYIDDKVADVKKQNRYGRTLLGLRRISEVDDWVVKEAAAIAASESALKLFEVLWPFMTKQIRHEQFRRCSSETALREMASRWIAGEAYGVLFSNLSESGAHKVAGSQKRRFSLWDVVDICENGIGFEGAHVVAGVIEVVGEAIPDLPEEVLHELRLLQKQLRYGLPDTQSIIMYELGFADRVVAQALAQIADSGISTKRAAISWTRGSRTEIAERLQSFPAYYQLVHRQVMTQ